MGDEEEEDEDDDDDEDLRMADTNYSRSSRIQSGCPTVKPMFQKRARRCSSACCMRSYSLTLSHSHRLEVLEPRMLS